MAWIANKIRDGFKCLKQNGFKYTVKLFFRKIDNKFFSKNYYGIFLKIIYLKIYQKERKIKYVSLFGKRVFFNIHRKNEIYSGEPIYFTVNKLADYTLLCIQHWVDIAHAMNSDFYFICDNKQLKYKILEKIKFYNDDIKFLKSNKKSLPICKNISTSNWSKAACAHLTSFYDAKKKGINKFWKIDADDTTFCLNAEKVSVALNEAKKIAKTENIAVFSLDMWRSQTLGRHWSWGVTYVDTTNTDFFELFKSVKDLSWTKAGEYPYAVTNRGTNIDWFMTYLNIHKGLRAATFYVENLYFVHWGNFLQAPSMVAAVYYWNNDKLTFPIYRYIHQNERTGFINIASDCKRIDIGITKKDGVDFLNKDMIL